MITWAQLTELAPELARFGADRLCAQPSYLATVKADGAPRVHPVTPIISARGLYVFMEPTSPKGDDVRERKMYSLHSGVLDNGGSSGEFIVSGHGFFIDDAATRIEVVASSSYPPADRYILFELQIESARAKTYGDVPRPSPHRWPPS